MNTKAMNIAKERVSVFLRRGYRRLSIKWKLMIILTSLLLFMSALFLLGFNFVYRLYDKQLLDNSSETLNLYSTNIENELRNIENLTFTFFTDNKTQTNIESVNAPDSSYEKNQAIDVLRKTLLAASQSEIYISSVSFFNLSENELTVGNSVTPFDKLYLNDLFKQLEDNAGVMIWAEPMTEDHSFIAARQIRAVDNLRSLGYIIIRINPQQLVKWVSSTWPDYEGDMVILTNENKPIYINPRIETPGFLDILSLKDQPYAVQDIGGHKYLLTRLVSPYTGWSYINLLSYESIFKGILTMRTALLFVFVILLAGVLAIGVKFSDHITKPIILLSKRMRRVESGEFDLKISDGSLDEQGDEIVQLRRDFAIMVDKIDTLIKEDYVKQLRIKESELRALQAQINPHFLYNTLQSIHWEAKIHKHDKISSMVKALGFLLRKATSGQQGLVKIEEELELLESYLIIQKYRYEERLAFSQDIDPHTRNIGIVKMSLQPLVENAIKYGAEKHEGICRIHVSTQIEGDTVALRVSDNGTGMNPAILEQLKYGEIRPTGTGIGLMNIDERIKLTFGDAYGLLIQSEEGAGTSVTIRIPLQKE
jgi:two-component system sensor histidine kinase YesM